MLQVYLNGYHGDCSKMFEVEECDDEAKRLISMTELCLKSAIDICKPNENFSSIGNRNNSSVRHNVYIFPIYF